jgi:hypothetical protein
MPHEDDYSPSNLIPAIIVVTLVIGVLAVATVIAWVRS